jgi:hypothetical protein
VIKGGREPAPVGLQDMYSGTRHKKPGKLAGKIQARRQKRHLFPMSVCLDPPPTCPRGDGDFDKAERRVGRSGSDLRTESTGCDGGINERMVFSLAFPLLSSARPKSRGS